ncbi:MAG: hypothetical protein NT105_19025 [Verrucomicrobia bacterium]|nr:hypothetical protein [Verrucomicrobiota bacterium]
MKTKHVATATKTSVPAKRTISVQLSAEGETVLRRIAGKAHGWIPDEAIAASLLHIGAGFYRDLNDEQRLTLLLEALPAGSRPSSVPQAQAA